MKKSNHSAAKSAFTMVELMVSTAVSVIVLASMVSTFIVFASGSKSVGAYTEMSAQSRKALEVLSRDIRAAEDVTVATKDEVVVVFPENDFYDGDSVQYVYDDMFGIFSRVEKDKSGNVTSNQVLLDGVEQFALVYFDPLGGSLSYSTPSLLLSIKSLRVDAEMVRKISQTNASDYIISARFMMRNRPVTK